jgi:hypothetical protein
VERHPVFARILMHSDAELGQALGAGIVDRKTVHQWPLSCVQRLVLANGRKLAYKSQLPPTVESQFYASISSTLLPGHRLLTKTDDCEIMTIDWIDAPLLRNSVCTDADLVRHGRRIISEIGEIRGEPPIYLNLATAYAWLSSAEAAIYKLRKLIETGWFRSTTPDEVEEIRKWVESSDVVNTVTDHTRLVHGDLKASQVFVAGDGYRVIDWPRPIIGPPEVDLVSLLVGERIDPRSWVNPVLVGVFWFQFLCWAVHAQFDLFPDLEGSLFDRWSSAAITQILDANAPLPTAGIPPP